MPGADPRPFYRREISLAPLWRGLRAAERALSPPEDDPAVPPGPIPRVPELDSLRAFAALVVILFHLRPMTFYPGWSGVDLFFVLSGFLITTIILTYARSRSFITSFYLRRSLRIWPIYYLALLTLVAINPLLHPPESLKGLPYFLTYTQRVHLYWTQDQPKFHKGFEHTWTLALEEQFYIVWPALVVLVGRRYLVRLTLGVMALSVLARAGGFLTRDRFEEWLLLSRSDGFALGGLLAAVLLDRARVRAHRRTFRRSFLLIGAGAMAYLIWGGVTHGGLGFIGLPTPAWPGLTIFAFGLLYAALIGLCVCYTGDPWLAPLRLRWLVYLGKISYGLYLYHYIVNWAYNRMIPGHREVWWLDLAKLATTLAVAIVSWELIERPILGLKERFQYRPSESPAVADLPGKAV